VVFAFLCYNLFWRTRILRAFATHTVAVAALRLPPAFISADDLNRAVCAFFSLSLLRPRQRLQETRTSPFSQSLTHDSHSQNTLSHTTPVSSSCSSATPSTPVPTSQLGKRPVPTDSHLGNNTKIQNPLPPSPPVRALQGLTLHIRGMTPAKWLCIQGLSVFSSLEYIILTEHQQSTEFQPDEIVKKDATSMSYPVLSQPFPNEDIEDSGTEVDWHSSPAIACAFQLPCTH